MTSTALIIDDEPDILSLLSLTIKRMKVETDCAESVEQAIQNAVDRAKSSLEKLSWFEVQELRGHIGDDGNVCEYQVILKIAFELS